MEKKEKRDKKKKIKKKENNEKSEIERSRLVIIGDKFFIWRDANKDLHTHKGIIKKEFFSKIGEIETHLGIKGYILPLDLPNYIINLKRGPAIINPKDFGIVIALTGIGKKSVVVDAGTGTGAMAIMLANVCKKVYTYEIREDFYKIASKNIEHSGMKNIILKKGDVYKNIEEKQVDVIFLDLPQPWKAVESVKNALKKGGFLVAYTPQISQAQQVVETFKDKGFMFVTTIQPLCIEWVIDGKIVRPKHMQKVHTGFLTFMRKIK